LLGSAHQQAAVLRDMGLLESRTDADGQGRQRRRGAAAAGRCHQFLRGGWGLGILA